MPETGGTYYDRQEVRDAEEREVSIFHALPGLIRHALDNAPLFAELLAGVEPDAIVSRADLARLPLLRKSDLSELQARHRTHRIAEHDAWMVENPLELGGGLCGPICRPVSLAANVEGIESAEVPAEANAAFRQIKARGGLQRLKRRRRIMRVC